MGEIKFCWSDGLVAGGGERLSIVCGKAGRQSRRSLWVVTHVQNPRPIRGGERVGAYILRLCGQTYLVSMQFHHIEPGACCELKEAGCGTGRGLGARVKSALDLRLIEQKSEIRVLGVGDFADRRNDLLARF